MLTGFFKTETEQAKITHKSRNIENGKPFENGDGRLRTFEKEQEKKKSTVVSAHRSNC